MHFYCKNHMHFYNKNHFQCIRIKIISNEEKIISNIFRIKIISNAFLHFYCKNPFFNAFFE